MVSLEEGSEELTGNTDCVTLVSLISLPVVQDECGIEDEKPFVFPLVLK